VTIFYQNQLSLNINLRSKLHFPSDYATRGFDVTFDTMMRMAQEVKFEETVNAVATEHVESLSIKRRLYQ
jgi:hypothetical protein